MLMLLAGLMLFFAPHSVALVAPSWRNRMVMHLRPHSWKGVYSLISAAGLILIVFGFAQARRAPVVLYVSPAWLRVTWVLMLPVFRLLFAAYLPDEFKERRNIRCWRRSRYGRRRICWSMAHWPTCCCSAAFSSGRSRCAFAQTSRAGAGAGARCVAVTLQ